MKKKYIIKKARKLLVEQINSHQTIVRNDMNNIETMSNMKGLSEVTVLFIRWIVPMD